MLPEEASYKRVRCGDILELLSARYVRQRFAPHHHDTWSIGVVEQGAHRTRFRGTDVTVNAGQIIVLSPGEVHTGEPVDDDGWAYRMMYLTPEWCADLIAASGSPAPHFAHAAISDTALAAAIRNAHVALEAGADELHTETLLSVAIGTLFSRYAAVDLGPARLDPPAIGRVIDYLHANLKQRVRLADLAAIAGLSGYHLVRVFGRSVGLPPYKYLEQLRVERAKELLRAGDPISGVAYDTGFADQSHFTRRFKRVVGVPPGQYARAVA